VADLLDKFVCVRIVQSDSLDLALFQFDYNLTWAVFFMNADKAIYGRYGSRSRNKAEDISLEGFQKAMTAVLELHKQYPANKELLGGKTGPKPQWPTPEAIPPLAGEFKKIQQKQRQCIHCHEIQDALVKFARTSKLPVADKDLWSYLMPDVLGLDLDPKEMATVQAVTPGSAAEQAGFKKGDAIRKLQGQPVISIADVQWLLHQAPERGTVKAEVERGGQKLDLTLALAEGWRRQGDFSWREGCWEIRHSILGLEPFKELTPEQRKKQGLANEVLGFAVKLPPGFVKGPNVERARKLLRDGDILVELDGQSKRLSESEILAYLVQKKKSGDKLSMTVLRGGQRIPVELPVP
jgi:hypothetical protein